MSSIISKKPLAIAIGAAFVGSLAGAGTAVAADNPFGMSELSSGYMVASSHEGKCGEGKCGGKMKENKCGEGKCGMKMMDADGDGKITKEEFVTGHEKMFDKMDGNSDGVVDGDEMKKMMEAKCGEGRCGGAMKEGKMKEGKCGEGKCGANK